VLFVLKFSKWPPFQNDRQYKNKKNKNKLLKIKNLKISTEMDIYRVLDMLHHMATILVCYGSHFESKMATKISNSSDLGKILFPSRL
jgi:hypothetical protein